MYLPFGHSGAQSPSVCFRRSHVCANRCCMQHTTTQHGTTQRFNRHRLAHTQVYCRYELPPIATMPTIAEPERRQLVLRILGDSPNARPARLARTRCGSQCYAVVLGTLSGLQSAQPCGQQYSPPHPCALTVVGRSAAVVYCAVAGSDCSAVSALQPHRTLLAAALRAWIDAAAATAQRLHAWEVRRGNALSGRVQL